MQGRTILVGRAGCGCSCRLRVCACQHKAGARVLGSLSQLTHTGVAALSMTCHFLTALTSLKWQLQGTNAYSFIQSYRLSQRRQKARSLHKEGNQLKTRQQRPHPGHHSSNKVCWSKLTTFGRWNAPMRLWVIKAKFSHGAAQNCICGHRLQG